MMRSLAVVALTACLVASPGVAMAAGDGTPGGDDGTVTVNGRTYGPADGLAFDRGTLRVSRGTGGGATVAAGEPSSVSGVVTPQFNGTLYKWSWGTSYVSSQESNFVWYYAKARAMANVSNSKRVIQVTGGYSLCNSDGTRYNSPLLVSSARLAGSAWLADTQERMLKVSDNITAPSTCKTQFPTHYATLINSNVY